MEQPTKSPEAVALERNTKKKPRINKDLIKGAAITIILILLIFGALRYKTDLEEQAYQQAIQDFYKEVYATSKSCKTVTFRD